MLSWRRKVILWVEDLFSHLSGTYHPITASLLYGSGSRLMDASRLRVKDFEFDYHPMLVRDGNAGKDRRIIKPAPAQIEPLSW